MKSYPLLCLALLSFLAGSFQSRAAAPIAVTAATSNVSSNAATLHGMVTPRAANTRAYFQWGLTTNYGNLTATQVLSGSVAIPVQQTLSGLLPQTTYHFRMVARNAYGVRYGTNFPFTTAGFLPLATTLNPTDITGSAATLRGLVEPNNLATDAFFEWGLTTNYNNVTATQTLAAGSASVSVQEALSGLSPLATYHVRMVARNAEGVRYGSDVSFVTTPRMPTVTTAPATVAGSIATLNGTVNPNGAVANVQFEWGTTTAYGNSTAIQIVPGGTNSVPMTATIGPLAPNAYHFRIVATSADGSAAGADQLFAVETNGAIVLNSCAEADFRAAFLTYRTVRFASDCVITLTSPLIVTSEKVLDATGRSVVLSGGDSTRLFDVSPGAILRLNKLALRNGRTQGANSPYSDGGPGEGGAMKVTQATLIAVDCRFELNRTQGGAGGAIPTVPPPRGGAAYGGAIRSDASVILLVNCSFLGNQSVGGAAGTGSGFLGTFGTAYGGALNATTSSVQIVNCSFQTNSAGAGGAIAISGGMLRIELSSLIQNNGLSEGGGILNDGASVIVSTCHFTGNAVVAPSSGQPTYGGQTCGGAICQCSGSLEVSDSEFISNAARGAPSGFDSSLSGPTAGLNGHGGAIGVLSGTASLQRATFFGNGATGGAASSFVGEPLYWANSGEGIGGAVFSQGTVGVTNCTFALNAAASGPIPFDASYPRPDPMSGKGGALATLGGTLQIFFSTIAGNAAFSGANHTNQSYGGGVFNGGGDTLLIANSILADNSVNTTNAGNAFGTITDGNDNISSDSTANFTAVGSMNNTNPLLLPLANNGGLTPTMALGAGSPALGSADCASAPPTDQRGYQRPSGAGCDIGAYEGSVTLQPYIHIFRESSSTNVLRWMAEAGRSYRIEESADLLGWTAAATNIASTNGWLDYRVPANPSPRFFRLLVQ